MHKWGSFFYRHFILNHIFSRCISDKLWNNICVIHKQSAAFIHFHLICILHNFKNNLISLFIYWLNDWLHILICYCVFHFNSTLHCWSCSWVVKVSLIFNPNSCHYGSQHGPLLRHITWSNTSWIPKPKHRASTVYNSMFAMTQKQSNGNLLFNQSVCLLCCFTHTMWVSQVRLLSDSDSVKLFQRILKVSL